MRSIESGISRFRVRANARPGMTALKMARGPARYAEPLILGKTRFLRKRFRFRYQPACKPGFVGHRPLARTIRDGHSSGTMFAHCLEQPTRTASLTSPCGVFAQSEQPALPSLFGFAPGVVCHAGSVAGPAVRSYRTFSPLLPLPFGWGSGSFSVALSLGSPPPDVIRHRMSMEPGLSSPAA